MQEHRKTKKRKHSYEKEKKKKRIVPDWYEEREMWIWKKTEQKRTNLNGWANEGAKLNWKRERITFVDVGVTVQMFINI